MSQKKVLQDAGFDSLQELEDEIANDERALSALEDRGLGTSTKAQKLRDNVSSNRAVREEYNKLSALKNAPSDADPGQEKLLRDAGFDSLQELEDEIADDERAPSALEDRVLGTSTKAQKLRDNVSSNRAVREEYNKLVDRDDVATKGYLQSSLHEILEEFQIDTYQELISEINKLEGEGYTSTRLKVLQKAKRKYKSHAASSIGEAVDSILENGGYSSISGLRDDVAAEKTKLKALEDSGKGVSPRAESIRKTVQGLQELLNAIEAILKISEEIRDANRPINRANPISDKLPYYIDIFHDVKNCMCEARRHLDARKVWSETLIEILVAHLWDPAGGSTRQDIETQVRQMNLLMEAHCNWRFCIRINDSNPYHPSQAFVTDLTTACGVTHVNVSFKKDAVDTEIAKQMMSYRRAYEAKSEEGKRKSIAVLISSDSDFCKDISSLQQQGCKVMILFDGSKAKDVFSSAVGPKAWDSILARSLKGDRRLPLVALLPTPFPDCDTSTDKDFKNALFHLANFMLQSTNGIRFPVKKITEFRSCFSKYWSVIENQGGIEEFCGKSQGAVIFDIDTLKLQLPFLLKFFVSFKGGKWRQTWYRSFTISFRRHEAVAKIAHHMKK